MHTTLTNFNLLRMCISPRGQLPELISPSQGGAGYTRLYRCWRVVVPTLFLDRGSKRSRIVGPPVHILPVCLDTVFGLPWTSRPECLDPLCAALRWQNTIILNLTAVAMIITVLCCHHRCMLLRRARLKLM